MRQDLKALKPFRYAGRALQAGDAFGALRRDARALVALGRAALVGTYQSAEVAPTVTKAPAKEAPAKKPATKKTKAPAK